MMFRRIVVTVLAVAMSTFVLSGPALAAGKAAPTGKVNINTATVDELTTLPGVGPKLAARIVEYRQKSGTFRTTEELLNVRGIGDKSYTKMKPLLTVGQVSKVAAKAK